MVRARAANAVYEPGKDAGCTKNLSAVVDEMNRALVLPEDAFKAGDFVDEESGFRAALFKSKSNEHYILAFAGTDPHALSDWQTNIDNGRGEDTIQYQAARSLAAKFKQYRITIDFTGHSKGGGLACDAGLIDIGAGVWTFNSAGLPVDSSKRPESTIASVAELATRTKAFHTDGDFLTALQRERRPADQIANAKRLKSLLEGKVALGVLKIVKMNPSGTRKSELPSALKKFHAQLDGLIAMAETHNKAGTSFDLFPTAIGKPHVLGLGWTASAFPKEIRPLIRHLMKGKLRTNGVLDDLESENATDQKTIQRFLQTHRT